MLIDLFFQSPGIALAWVVVIVLALSMHEFSHAIVAYLKGDSTPEQYGRLTLNPLAHIDPIGLIPLFLFGFGWAKPVPYNPYHFKNPRWDSLLVSLAGPFSNLVLASVGSIAYRIVHNMQIDAGLLPLLLLILVFVNLLLFFFNLIPVYPLDGAKMIDAFFIKPQHQIWVQRLKIYGPQILLVLVLISLFTSLDIFFFVSVPAQIGCFQLTGTDCLLELSRAL